MAAFVPPLAVSYWKDDIYKTGNAVGCVGLKRFGDKQFAGQLVLACPLLPIGLVELAEPDSLLV